MERMLVKERTIPAGQHGCWTAWTTSEGAQAFFAPKCNIVLSVGGLYEVLFFPDAPPGQRGADGMMVLSYLPERMLSFSWNAPMEFGPLRNARTWVVIEIAPRGAESSLVHLTHLGWGEGEGWDAVYAYFVDAWDIVLERLVQRFVHGPLDWGAIRREREG